MPRIQLTFSSSEAARYIAAGRLFETVCGMSRGYRWRNLFRRTRFGQYELSERAKFVLADLLDHMPSLCWVALAEWAMNLRPWWSSIGVLHNGGDDYDYRQTCRWVNGQQIPWCGKCLRNDRWLIGCTPEQRAAAIERMKK